MDLIGDFLNALFHTGAALAPSLFLGLLIAGLLHVFVAREKIFRHLGKPGPGSAFRASLLGVPLPLCSCGVLPAALSLRRDGASRGAAVSFLASTPQTGVDSIVPTWAMLGWPIAVAKVVAALVAGFVSGTIVDLLEKDDDPSHVSVPDGGTMEEGPVIKRIIGYAWSTLFRDIYGWLFIGIVLSALITVFIQPGQLSEYPFLSGGWGMLAALAIGIPLYVCSVSSIPIAAALVYAGFPVGSALVFLMAGPVTNAATMGAVRRKLGKIPFLSYIITVIAVSLVAGVLLNGLDLNVSHAVHIHGDSGYSAKAAAVVMFAGMAWFLVKDLKRKAGAEGGSRLTGRLWRIEGMTCVNCERRVGGVLSGLEDVHSFSLENGTAVIVPSSEYSGARVAEALKKAGYPAVEKGGECGCEDCGRS